MSRSSRREIFQSLCTRTLCLSWAAVLQLAVVCAQQSSTCNDVKVTQCFEWFIAKHSRELDGVFPFSSVDTLNSICRDFDAVEQCFRPVKLQCTDTDIEMFEGIEEAYGHMCSATGRDVYGRNVACFSNANLQEDGHACNISFQHQVDALRQQLIATNDRVAVSRSYCGLINQYLQCIRTALSVYCGEEIAEWQKTVDEKKLKPLLRTFHCQLSWQLSPGATAGIVIGCICAVVLIAAFLVIVCQRIRRQRRKASKLRGSRVKHLKFADIQPEVVEAAAAFGDNRPTAVSNGYDSPRQPPPM